MDVTYRLRVSKLDPGNIMLHPPQKSHAVRQGEPCQEKGKESQNKEGKGESMNEKPKRKKEKKSFYLVGTPQGTFLEEHLTEVWFRT